MKALHPKHINPALLVFLLSVSHSPGEIVPDDAMIGPFPDSYQFDELNGVANLNLIHSPEYGVSSWWITRMAESQYQFIRPFLLFPMGSVFRAQPGDVIGPEFAQQSPPLNGDLSLTLAEGELAYIGYWEARDFFAQTPHTSHNYGWARLRAGGPYGLIVEESATAIGESIVAAAPVEALPNPYFQVTVDRRPEFNLSLRDVALGDLDNDGDLDAFTANDRDAPNLVLLNNGAGHFNPAGAGYGASSSQAVALGDLDNDGDLDAFVANAEQSNRVWLNDGHGSFSEGQSDMGPTASAAVALGDLDADGDLDAWVANTGTPFFPRTATPGGANEVWVNDGSAQFTRSRVRYGDRITIDVQLGDLDGDADLDAFTVEFETGTRRGPNCIVWSNDGTGTFRETWSGFPGILAISAALGDLNQDGDLDAIIAAGVNNRILENSGSGQFSSVSPGSIGPTGGDVALADFENDGDLDIWIGDGSTNWIWVNQGSLQFTQSSLAFHTFNSSGLRFGDLDADGAPDLFAVQFGGTQLYFNNGASPRLRVQSEPLRLSWRGDDVLLESASSVEGPWAPLETSDTEREAQTYLIPDEAEERDTRFYRIAP